MDFLGIDVGTRGSRAVLINDLGVTLASETIEHVPFFFALSWLCRTGSERLVASIRSGDSDCFGKESIRAVDVGAVGFSGQMHGSVFLDDKGEVLRPALLWCDQRTEKQCSEIDVYGQSVELLEAEEGAAFGAAILGGGGGAWPTVDEACQKIIRPRALSSRMRNRPCC